MPRTLSQNHVGEVCLSGDTWPIRHTLRGLGGRWQANSKSWAFPDTAETRAALAPYVDTAAAPVPAPAPMPAPAEAPTPAPSGVAGLPPAQVSAMIAEALQPVRRHIAEHASTLDDLAASLQAIAASVASRKPEVIELRCGDAPTRTVDGLAHYALPTLIRALDAGLHVWLAGPSGSGKTHGAEQAAKALGLGFELQGAMTMAHELTGFVDAGGRYHETPFTRAFRNGGLILLDELDAGSNEALLALNAALANGIMSLPSGEVVRVHKAFKCIGAANTFGAGATAEYVGRTRIDAAFLQRFGARIMWGYDEELELAMSGNQDWARRVQKARAAAKDAGLKVLITPRASQAGARLIAGGMAPDDAARLTYLADLSTDQRRMIGEVA